jgi:heme exporter protein C
VYSIIAFVAVPPLIFVVPRIYSGLHPDPIINNRGKVEMDPMIRWCFLSMLVGFTFLYSWLQSLRVRVSRLERRLAA